LIRVRFELKIQLAVGEADSEVHGGRELAGKQEGRAFEGEDPTRRWRVVEEACCTFRRPLVHFERS
jgi:hypothetical protein